MPIKAPNTNGLREASPLSGSQRQDSQLSVSQNMAEHSSVTAGGDRVEARARDEVEADWVPYTSAAERTGSPQPPTAEYALALPSGRTNSARDVSTQSRTITQVGNAEQIG